MKKYQYLASWDDQTLTRIGEPVVVLGDSNVSQVKVTMPSNFLLDPTKAVARMYFLLPGEKESDFETLETATKDENGDSHVTWTIKHAHSQRGGRLAFSLALIGDDAQWDSRTAIIPVYESRYQPESEEAEEPYTGRLTALEGSMASIRGEFTEVQEDFEELKETVTLGTPIPKSLASEMVGGGVYLYTGTESGYTAGHVYYYVDGTLTDGGVYGGTAVDATLTQSGQAADAKVTGDKIAEIKEDLSAISGNEILTGWVKGKLINTSVSAVNIESPINSAGYHYLIADCAEGDIFTVSGVGGGTGRLWCFVDSNNTNIAVAAEKVTETNLVLVAPAGATKLIVNSNDSALARTYAIKGYHVSLPQKTATAALDVLGVKDFAFTVGLITTSAIGTTVDFSSVFNAQYCHAIVECKAGEKFTITGTTNGTSGKRVYLFTDTNHKCLYRHDADASLTDCVVYAPADGFLVVNSYLANPHKVNSDSIIDWILKAPLTYLTPNIKGALSNKIVGPLSKGYIVMMTDDGNEGLATDTIPFAITKNIPFTFAVMSSSKVFANETYTATVLDAVNSHGCELSQHGGSRWDDKSEAWLNNFFDNEKSFWNTLGVSVRSAAIPGHWTTELIKAVCGGRFGVVRSGYKGVDFATGGPSGEVTNYYDYYTSGARSNIYCLSSFNCSKPDAASNLIPAVDYAYSNNKILICYFHENAMDSEAWQRVSDFVDYAKSKGLTFTTLGQIPYLL